MILDGIKSLILDFDGTIADTEVSIYKTIEETMKQFGVYNIERDKVKQFIGLPLKDTFSKALGLTDDDVEKSIRIYRSKYKDIAFETTKLFPKVKETIEQAFKMGIYVSVASSKGREDLNRLLHKFEVADYLYLTLGEQDVTNKKPAPDLVNLVIEKTNVDRTKTLVVGDMIYDIQMGKNSGCRTCGVTYGNGSRKQLEDEGSDYVIDSFDGLITAR